MKMKVMVKEVKMIIMVRMAMAMVMMLMIVGMTHAAQLERSAEFYECKNIPEIKLL